MKKAKHKTKPPVMGFGNKIIEKKEEKTEQEQNRNSEQNVSTSYRKIQDGKTSAELFLVKIGTSQYSTF